MKKNVLASSVAAALIGLGMAGAAHASNILVVPYYTAQTQHATLLNIVNTDTKNGKAVKVRFRGAANSDDVFDFQLFLSPGDVWTGQVAQNAAGLAQLTTNDNSCTKPAKSVLNSTPFITSRLNPALTAEQKAEQTREGYVEIFVMADIPKGVQAGQLDDDTTPADKVNDLYTVIKHKNSVAPCSGADWTALDKAVVGAASGGTGLAGDSVAAGNALGLALPTGGLFANYTVINVARAGAWDGEAVAVSTPDVTEIPYWPQTAEAVAAAEIVKFSADPLFSSATTTGNTGAGGTPGADTTAAIKAGAYDLPDLSTAYDLAGASAAAADPVARATAVSTALATTAVTNEFLTNADIQATTDWVFSMPSRRYWVAMDYAAANAATTAAPDDGRRFTNNSNNFFQTANTAVSGGLICVRNITSDVWDQEENQVTESTEVVVSPSSLPPATLFCGEASVLSINGGGAKPTPTVNASVAVTDLDVGSRTAGWISLSTPGAVAVADGGVGLPVVGQSFTRAAAGDSFFAGSWAHRRGVLTLVP